MNILTRHLFTKIMYYLFISSLILIGLIFALQSTKLLNLFIDSSAGIMSFLYLVTVSLPSLLQEIIPIIALLTTILVVNSLKNSNEVTIMRAIGLSEFMVYKTMFIAIIFVSLMNFVVTNNLIPKFESKYLVAKHNLSNNAIDLLISQQKQSKIIQIGHNESLYIENIDKHGNISNMVLYTPSENKNITISSESGKISKDATNAPILFLENATLVTLSQDSYSQLVLKEYIIYLQDVLDIKKKLIINQLSRKSMTLIELLMPKTKINKKLEALKARELVPENRVLSKKDISTYNIEAYRRILNIVNCFAFAIIALYFIGGNSSERKANNYLILKVIASVLILRILQLSLVFNSDGNIYILLSVVFATIALSVKVFLNVLKNAAPQK